MDEIGLGLGGLDIGGRGPRIGQLASVEQVEVVIDLVRLGGGGQHDDVPEVLEIRDQLPCALERLDLLDQGEVQRLLGGADVVSVIALGVSVRPRLHELVAAHADVAVDPPQREHDVVLAEGAVPREGVVVVGVDEGAVDVEYRGGHAGGFPHPRARETKGA